MTQDFCTILNVPIFLLYVIVIWLLYYNNNTWFKKKNFDYNYKLSSKTQISYSNTLAASTFTLQDILTIFSDVKLEVRWYNNCEPK